MVNNKNKLEKYCNEWFIRNKTAIENPNLRKSGNDVLLEVIQNSLQNIATKGKYSYCEIGCSSGQRFDVLMRSGIRCTGYDISTDAVQYGQNKGRDIRLGSAQTLCVDDQFSIVCLGFMLYLQAPDTWFSIMEKCDKLLLSGGLIIIRDFHATEFSCSTDIYDPNLKIYKYPFHKLFDWHPNYTLINTVYNPSLQKADKDVIYVLKKSENLK